MRRRLLPLLVLAAVGVPLAGCGGGTQSPAQQKRAEFIKKYGNLDDQQLQALCPSLYPSDFLKRPKHYRYTKKNETFKPTPQQRADARAAGCTNRGTPPQ